MEYLGTHWNRQTFWLDPSDNYQNELPTNGWVCLAISNIAPDEKTLEQFIRAAIDKNILEFKAQGTYGWTLHLTFDEVNTRMYTLEEHAETDIVTTGNNDTNLPNALWECYGATCLPDNTDYDNIKIVCVAFDGENYKNEIKTYIERFANGWLPLRPLMPVCGDTPRRSY